MKTKISVEALAHDEYLSQQHRYVDQQAELVTSIESDNQSFHDAVVALETLFESGESISTESLVDTVKTAFKAVMEFFTNLYNKIKAFLVNATKKRAKEEQNIKQTEKDIDEVVRSTSKAKIDADFSVVIPQSVRNTLLTTPDKVEAVTIKELNCPKHVAKIAVVKYVEELYDLAKQVRAGTPELDTQLKAIHDKIATYNKATAGMGKTIGVTAKYALVSEDRASDLVGGTHLVRINAIHEDLIASGMQTKPSRLKSDVIIPLMSYNSQIKLAANTYDTLMKEMDKLHSVLESEKSRVQELMDDDSASKQILYIIHMTKVATTLFNDTVRVTEVYNQAHTAVDVLLKSIHNDLVSVVD